MRAAGPSRESGAGRSVSAAARPNHPGSQPTNGGARHSTHNAAQVSAWAYVLGMVTMNLALPHAAVLTGVSEPPRERERWRCFVAARCTCLLGGALRAPALMCLPALLRPHPPSLAELQIWSRSWQAGVIALGACMLYTLRGRISGGRILPTAGGSAAQLAGSDGPKHQ